MSTKIYNGYRVRGLGVSQPDVFALTSHLREVLAPIHRKLYTRTVAAQTAALLDRNVVRAHDGAELDRSEKAPVFVISGRIEDSMKDLDTGHATSLHLGHDFRFKVTLMPDPENSPGPVYALVFTALDEYEDAWANLPGVDEYGYWNNSDTRPDGVTAADWEVRKAVWNRVLGRRAPVECGMSWKLFGSYHPLSPRMVRDDLVAAIPSVAARAREVARYLVPAATLVDGGIEFRDVDAVKADVDREAARIEPLLGPLTDADLFDFQDVDIDA